MLLKRRMGDTRMNEFLQFVARIGQELFDLFSYVSSGKKDLDKERELAMRIVRKATDEQARNEIEGT